MIPTNTKYPRTYHLPWSPGTTSDDKKLSGDWFDMYKGKEIIITEKLDGENIAINRYDCYARSHGAPTRSPWSINIWGKDGIFQNIYDKLGENEWIFGENLYGEHSIHYDKLPNYYFLFAVMDTEEYVWYSWDEIRLVSEIIKIPTVPELWRGIIESEEQLKYLVNKFVNQPSVYGDTREGVVIRNSNEFPIDEFSKNVCKWVRPNHVQTDEHWTKNRKKAILYGN